MTYFTLPKDKMTGYSPLAFQKKIFEQAINNEQGTYYEKKAAVLDSKNKNKVLKIIENEQQVEYIYKQITEGYYASHYALAINKEWQIKHQIILSDNPDIILINQEDEKDRVAVEMYEEFDFKKRDTKILVNIEKEVKKLYSIKGAKDYGRNSRLLIINRINSIPNGFDVGEYYLRLNNYSWNFSHIILCLYRGYEGDYTFFYVYPKEMQCRRINFLPENDINHLY